LRRFDEVIGLEELRLVHLNDSKGGLGSGIDRHEHIGMGKIGERGFRNILHSRLGQLPLILETPIDKRRSDVENLRKVRELTQQ
jgi:deoxyribonuclease-4